MQWFQDLSSGSKAKIRSITPSNPTGEPGKANMATEGIAFHHAKKLGAGWKINPHIIIKPGEEAVIGNITGAGYIFHIWMTLGRGRWNSHILRMYWDNNKYPSVECPLGHFFCLGWERFSQISGLPICVNPASGMNLFLELPFREAAIITIENRSQADTDLYFNIDYQPKKKIPKNKYYFHANFNRSNPVPLMKEHILLDIKGRGHYIGTSMSIGVNGGGWWGEGPFYFLIDKDFKDNGEKEYPTLDYEGTEDFFRGSYNFDIGAREHDKPRKYTDFTGPYSGFHMATKPDGVYDSQSRFGMYNWNLRKINFKSRIKVSLKNLGWNPEGGYMARQDDISTVSYFYMKKPTPPFRELQDADYIMVL